MLRIGREGGKRLALLTGVVAGGCLLATLAETLRWWRIWRPSKGDGERKDVTTQQRETTSPSRPPFPLVQDSAPRKAILWLSGVSDYGDSEWMPEQETFVTHLAAVCPGSVAIPGNLPADRGVDAQFRRGDIWRRMGWARPPLWAWGLHNFWQFALASLCERTYGRDVAQIAIQRLQQAGMGVGSPLLIVCGSAGAQIAFALAPFLRSAGYARIYVIALGGAFASPRGLAAVTRGAQLTGEKDRWSRSCGWLFFGRWLPRSSYNTVRRDARLSVQRSGIHGHYGAGSYLDDAHTLPNGRTYADATWEAIQQLPWWEEWTVL